MSLLTSLVSGTSFAQFADFASPAFFKVMSMRKLMTQGKELVTAYRSQSAWADAVRERRAALVGSPVPVTLETSATPPGTPLTSDHPGARAHGESILALYFHQLATTAPTLIDLAPRRFWVDGDRLVWSPGAGHVRWDPSFRSAIANVYETYYGGGGESEEDEEVAQGWSASPWASPTPPTCSSNTSVAAINEP